MKRYLLTCSNFFHVRDREYGAERSTSKYCSPRCRLEAWRDRKQRQVIKLRLETDFAGGFHGSWSRPNPTVRKLLEAK